MKLIEMSGNFFIPDETASIHWGDFVVCLRDSKCTCGTNCGSWINEGDVLHVDESDGLLLELEIEIGAGCFDIEDFAKLIPIKDSGYEECNNHAK